VARVVEPDFVAVPPRAGLIESAWVDPASEPLAAWPPRRQRVVVRVLPAADGARMFRVHEVGPTRRVLEMVASIKGDRPPSRTVRGLA
jgi:hypothetical protein